MNIRRRAAPALEAASRAILLLASISSCGREVDVGAGEARPSDEGYTPPPSSGGSTSSSMVGVELTEPQGSVDDAAAGTIPSSNADAPPQGLTLAAVELLDGSLNVVRVPSVGDGRVSLLQYTNAGAAVTRHADWSGSVGSWHEADGAYHIYTAAAGTRHLSLVYAGSSYGVYANGESTELSGTPQTYKEFLAANADGFAWVDYETASSLGRIVFQTWNGSRRALTDDARYRAHIELSRDHIAYVEYASSAAGSVGQVFVQPLAGGEAVAVSPAPRHQDRPAVDGASVVWEEYLGPIDSVIRAYDIDTGEARDLSGRTGFRGGADVLDGRVVWEELQGQDGDIHVASLTGTGDWAAVGGSSHSAAARLTRDGLVWIEVDAGELGIMHGRWAQ